MSSVSIRIGQYILGRWVKPRAEAKGLYGSHMPTAMMAAVVAVSAQVARLCRKRILFVRMRWMMTVCVSPREWGKAAHRDAITWCLHLLERRLVDSDTSVIIPFDESIIFIHLSNRAEFSSRHSEVAQTFDSISGTQISASAGWVDKCRLLGTV